MSTQTEWIVKEAPVTVIAPGEPETEAHVMPATPVPENMSRLQAAAYASDLKRDGEPVAMFNGKMYAHWGHKASRDCECRPERTVDNDTGTAVWQHKHPA